MAVPPAAGACAGAGLPAAERSIPASPSLPPCLPSRRLPLALCTHPPPPSPPPASPNSLRSTLYDVFCNIRDDELEHVKTMVGCQDGTLAIDLQVHGGRVRVSSSSGVCRRVIGTAQPAACGDASAAPDPRPRARRTLARPAEHARHGPGGCRPKHCGHPSVVRGGGLGWRGARQAAAARRPAVRPRPIRLCSQPEAPLALDRPASGAAAWQPLYA